MQSPSSAFSRSARLIFWPASSGAFSASRIAPAFLHYAAVFSPFLASSAVSARGGENLIVQIDSQVRKRIDQRVKQAVKIAGGRVPFAGGSISVHAPALSSVRLAVRSSIFQRAAHLRPGQTRKSTICLVGFVADLLLDPGRVVVDRCLVAGELQRANTLT